MAEEGEIKVNLDSKPTRKTPKNFLVLIIGVAVGAVLVSMWMGGGAKKQSAKVAEATSADSTPKSKALIQELIDKQEADAKAQRAAEAAAAAEAQRKAAEQKPAMPSVKTADDGFSSGLSKKEMEMAIQAAISPIIAIKGNNATDQIKSALKVGGYQTVSMQDGGQNGTINDPMLRSIQQKAGVLLDQQIQQGQGAGRTTDPNQSFVNGAMAAQNEADLPISVKSAPQNPNTIFQGSIIPTVLNTGLNSDVPGMVTATSTSNVYDSITGRTLIIPRGTKFVGQYNSQINEGQERIMFAFTRMIFPDGRSAILSGMAGAGENGMSGAAGDVNTHFWQMLGSGLLIAGLSSTVDRLSSQGTNPVTNVYGGGGSSQGQTISSGGQVLVNTANQALSHYQNMKPTITVQAATPLNIMVNRDIVIPQ